MVTTSLKELRLSDEVNATRTGKLSQKYTVLSVIYLTRYGVTKMFKVICPHPGIEPATSESLLNVTHKSKLTANYD